MTTPIDEMKDLFEWTSVRWNKCLTLYQLAQEATGPIAELGTYNGNGTIALGLGSRDGNNVQIYGVDQWQRFTGLYAQQFYASDYDDCKANIAKVGLKNIELVKGNSKFIGQTWLNRYPKLSAVVWDISLPQLYSDWQAWRINIKPGGLFVAKDTTIYDFGWLDVKREALELGWQPVFEDKEACLYAVRKPL